MTNWPEYESHKVVRAAKIVAIRQSNDPSYPPHIFVHVPGAVGAEEFTPTEPAMIARAEVGGYAILYPDGFKSISPAKPFEEGYTRKTGES